MKRMTGRPPGTWSASMKAASLPPSQAGLKSRSTAITIKPSKRLDAICGRLPLRPMELSKRLKIRLDASLSAYNGIRRGNGRKIRFRRRCSHRLSNKRSFVIIIPTSMSRLSWLITTIVIAAALSLAGPPATAQSRSNPVMDQMIQALGGPAFVDVKEIQTGGRFFAFTKGELSGSDIFADYIKFPDMERTEFGFGKKQ